MKWVFLAWIMCFAFKSILSAISTGRESASIAHYHYSDDNVTSHQLLGSKVKFSSQISLLVGPSRIYLSPPFPRFPSPAKSSIPHSLSPPFPLPFLPLSISSSCHSITSYKILPDLSPDSFIPFHFHLRKNKQEWLENHGDKKKGKNHM